MQMIYILNLLGGKRVFFASLALKTLEPFVKEKLQNVSSVSMSPATK